MAEEHYRVLALRTRPKAFGDVIGQDHIVKTLQNAIRSDRVAHAYLLSGPRGTGKTTTARLLAKALNCEQGPTPDPCGECAACKAIVESKSMDVLEIDGASNRGIDEIRQLREEAGYAVSKGKRRIYIIDEVHMLTPEAFNALLKTLEEPPPHVVFVFATTEPTKVPDTILSRCQRYNFRRIPTSDILAQLKVMAEGEGLKADEEALLLVARKADGAMRDGLSLLEQVLAFSDGEVSAHSVRDLLGIIPRDLYFGLFEAILARDGKAALALLASVMEEGGDVGEFTQGLLEHLRHLLIASVSKSMASEDLPAADKERYVDLAGELREDDLLQMLQVVSELELTLGRVAEPRFWLELTVMKLVKLASTESLEALVDRLGDLEVKLANGGRSSSQGQPPEDTPLPPAGPQVGNPPVAPSAPAPVARQTPAPSGLPEPSEDEPPPVGLFREPPGPSAGSAPAPAPSGPAPRAQDPPEQPRVDDDTTGELSLEAIRSAWDDVLQAVKKKKISVGTFLLEGNPNSLQGNQLTILFQVPNAFHANQVRRNREAVEAAIQEVCGVSVRVATDLEQRTESSEQGQDAATDENVQIALRIMDGEIMNR